MQLIKKNELAPGLVWVEVKDADLYLCCGCPPDATKFLKKEGLLKKNRSARGPNAILISDINIQKGRIKNLAEFPLMDMLYNQEMIKSTEEKPLVIGLKDTVDQQVGYTIRGNYGYFSKEEMLEAGITDREAERLMQLKLWFANHHIYKADEMFKKIYLGTSETEIKNGVVIRREGIDQFTIKYKDQSCNIDLNIPEHDSFQLPYKLGDYDTELNSFSIMHSGEGNGWYHKNPCMGSILVHEGKIYAIDTGPGFADIINHLGLDVQDIDGIFLTHNHDDHFAGLADLLKSTRQIDFYASKLVRLTVQKKMAELLGLKESVFHHFFKVHDLMMEEWNQINGLDVKPFFTPHPVETNAFIFRKTKGGVEKIYTHLADTISFKNYRAFLDQSASKQFDDTKEIEKLKAHYLTPSQLKKIDIGGGLIHGVKEDFSDDKSDQLVFSHTEKPGVRIKGGEKHKSSFGTQELFFSGKEWDYVFPIFERALKDNFPDISTDIIKELYSQTHFVNKKRGGKFKITGEKVVVIISGNICENNVRFSDKILLERSHILGLEELFDHSKGDFTANSSFVKAVEIDKASFISKVKSLKSWSQYTAKRDMIRVIESSEICRNFSCSNVKLRLAENAAFKVCTEERVFKGADLHHLWIVKQGTVHLRVKSENKVSIREGGFFGAGALISYGMDDVNFQAIAGTILIKIPENAFKDIPLILWTVYENCTTMDHICKVKRESTKHAGKDS